MLNYATFNCVITSCRAQMGPNRTKWGRMGPNGAERELVFGEKTMVNHLPRYFPLKYYVA